jgi:hypothetical protein
VRGIRKGILHWDFDVVQSTSTAVFQLLHNTLRTNDNWDIVYSALQYAQTFLKIESRLMIKTQYAIELRMARDPTSVSFFAARSASSRSLVALVLAFSNKCSAWVSDSGRSSNADR